ncbi:TrbC/VirB2 family protein [Novosphingobium aquiterrae]|uniref:TrbC/VirB2 family protein n=1 Tax=Novosphingobium aquiterrae TaxID=624388 RepID=A0ABV6PKP6_9SPHN
MTFAGNYSATNVNAGALAVASNWVAGLLTGTAGTTFAILAVAGIGLAMLQGRVAVCDGFRVVAGCFILFGAPAIARELLGLASWNAGPAVFEVEVAPSPPPISLPSPPQRNRDPYAGASVPQ